MPTDHALKIGADHLRRDAFLYVRQSSLRQVFENTESTKRQYGLRQRAVALGWAEERVIVIDSDLGLSGASSDREGFQRLVAERMLMEGRLSLKQIADELGFSSVHSFHRAFRRWSGLTPSAWREVRVAAPVRPGASQLAAV
mgnify:CR=1 FL=1